MMCVEIGIDIAQCKSKLGLGGLLNCTEGKMEITRI